MSITQEDILSLDEQDDNLWVEVQNGEIVFVERNFTWFEALMLQELFYHLKLFIKENSNGILMYDGARYILIGTKESIQRAYIPDLSFIKKENFPIDFDWQGDFFGAPDLAVEVVSHSITNQHIIARIAQYFEAGTGEVWLIYPNQKMVYLYHSDSEAPMIYRIDDTLKSALFPNWELKISQLFNPKH